MNSDAERQAVYRLKPFRPSIAMRLEPAVRRMRKIAALVQGELASPARLPLAHRIRAWRHGFSSEAYAVCALQDKDLDGYLSDYEQNVLAWRIVEPYAGMLFNKLNMTLLFEGLGVPCPAVYGLVRQGRILPLATATTSGEGWLQDLLALRGRLVFKRLSGFKGLGFMVLSRDAEGMRLNGVPVTAADLSRIVSNLDHFLITDFIEQAAYARAIYPAATNTLRVLTLWDVDAGRPFMARAAHRFGTRRSLPVDNWKGGRGGLSAEIDETTAELGPAVTGSDRGTPVWHDAHPETGAPIRGVRVPGWDACRALLLRAAAAMPYLPSIGWDVTITESGLCVLEGNASPGLRLFQVHRPLLDDPRIRRYYRYHRALSSRHRP